MHMLSVWFLIFMLGATVVRYRLPGVHLIQNGFVAAEAWLRALDESRSERQLSDEMRESIAKNAEIMLSSAAIKGNEHAKQDGYILMTMGLLPYPVLMDKHGNILHRWKIDTRNVWGATSCTNIFRASAHFVDTAHLFENGDIIAQFADHGAPYGCGIMRVDKAGNIKWVYNGLVHHDFAVDEHQNTYTLLQETVSEPIKGYENLQYPMTVDTIAKLDDQGKQQQRISILEAFRDTPYALMMFAKDGDRDDEYDMLHTNAIDVLTEEMAGAFTQFEAGDILISSRATNIIAVISQKTHKVKWAYRGVWRFQHAAHFIDNGTVLILDNQGHYENGKIHSRALELDPKTLEIKWAFVGGRDAPFLTEKVGRLQRLENGNTIIVDSQHARILEVTAQKKVIWEYRMEKQADTNDYTDAIYHAESYTKKQLPFLDR